MNKNQPSMPLAYKIVKEFANFLETTNREPITGGSIDYLAARVERHLTPVEDSSAEIARKLQIKRGASCPHCDVTDCNWLLHGAGC